MVYLFIGLFLASPSKAQAQSVSLGLYPPIFKINTTPPSIIVTPLVVKNFTDQLIVASISLKPFKNSLANNGELTYLNAGEPIPGNDALILQRIQLYESGHPVHSVTFTPQEPKTLDLHINLPQDEPASDYYFSILFVTNGIGNDQSNVSAVSGGIATNVLLSVGPTTPTTGHIKTFSTHSVVQHGPIPFILEVENTSTHFISPKGTILVQNMFGQFVGKLNLLPVNILENSSRFIPDDKNINETHAIWREKVLFGLYKAKATVALSDQGPIFTKTIYFFAMPTEAIIGLVLAILLGVTIFLRVRQKLQQL